MSEGHSADSENEQAGKNNAAPTIIARNFEQSISRVRLLSLGTGDGAIITTHRFGKKVIPQEAGQAFQINEITGPTAIFPAILLKAPSGGKNGFQEKPWRGEALSPAPE